MDKRQLFLKHVAQTSGLPLMLEVKRAKGMFIYSQSDKKYLDLNSGISVSSLGHRHPAIIEAIKNQCDQFLHTMVYGEHVQSPQVLYATELCKNLSPQLDSVYFVMTGSEAVEGALKLARKYTGRYEIISCASAYHGSTIGAEALRSDTAFTQAFQPSLPGIRHITFNDEAELEKINSKTAAVILEPVQAEGGVLPPKNDYLKKLRARCNETGTLMILDEIQTGFGRTGHLFAHHKYDVLPDILLIAKSMGGGMPIGAFVANQDLMQAISSEPMLGHITTFGGHPVSCASALATLTTLQNEGIVENVLAKEKLFKSLLVHPIIKEVRSSGLMMAVELTKRKYLKHVVAQTFELGALIDYFLFNNRSFRLAPPLIINEEQIKMACNILLQAMDYAFDKYNRT